uniref:MARVEL domain-containing protein n=1 Tax=Steinernema glaseri TaxID=37863 RepID=A0A1I7ZCW2_9BILA
MALILAAPGAIVCNSKGGRNGDTTACSPFSEDISVSNWNYLIELYGKADKSPDGVTSTPVDPAINSIWGQLALFILPLVFCLASIGTSVLKVNNKAEFLLLIVAALDSFACGCAEIWYSTGFGMATTIGKFTYGDSAKPDISIIIAGWCAAAALLLLNTILHAVDAFLIRRNSLE